MDRKAWSFALVGVAASLTIEESRITAARLILGGVATIPWRVQDAEAVLIGQPATPDVFERAAQSALTGAQPLTKNGYKLDLLKPMITRALAAASH
jgi:xanthine dehydrogenase YagS FAD-binding subunit